MADKDHFTTLCKGGVYMKYLQVMFICLGLFVSAISYAEHQELNFSAIKNAAYIKHANRVMTEAYKRMGRTFTITELPAKRSLVSSNSGKGLDGELFRIAGVEKNYTNLIPIKVPLSRSMWMVYTIDTKFKVNGWQSLKPYKIGVRNGVVTTDKGTAGMDTVSVNSNQQLFELLETGRVDIVVMSHSNGEKYLNKHPDTKIHSLTEPVQIRPVYHFVHKKNAYYIPKLTAILQDMYEQGVIEKAYQEYVHNL